MRELLDYLESEPSGPLVDDAEVIGLMAKLWYDFSLTGYDDGGMSIDKLYRAEDVTWEPPILSFRIERHGAVVAGSSKRADYQHWELDLVNCTKGWGPGGYRLVKPRDPVVNTKPLAEKYADLITKRAPDAALKYLSGEDSVRVIISKVDGLGDNNEKGQKLAKQTVQSRRKRFRNELEKLLQPAGWQRVRANVFSKQHYS